MVSQSIVATRVKVKGNSTTYYPRASGRRPSRAASLKFYLGSPTTSSVTPTAERATIEFSAHAIWLTGHQKKPAYRTA
jgi:hypothetical protein